MSTINTSESDDFQDAVEDNIDSEITFDVSKEEVSLIRAQLAMEFPEDYNYLSDAYITSVASKPYSKDPSIRRPLEYTQQKLSELMEWRQGNAIHLPGLLEFAMKKEDDPEVLADAEKYTKAKALTTSLNYGSMYWHGLDKSGRPVLWLRTNRMPWYPNVEAQVSALILLADAGIKCMPDGITDFVVISDSNSPPPPNPQFMINLLKALVKGYPDRLQSLISVPVGSIIQFVMNLLIPLMPGRLASKIIMIGSEQSKDKLTEILLNGESDIPTFLGGTADHDSMYPTDSGSGYFSSVTKALSFDYNGMVQRLEESVKNYTDMKN